jgi:hypothetical protein
MRLGKRLVSKIPLSLTKHGQTLKQYAKEAQAMIQSIAEQQDDEAWQKARQQNTTQSYQARSDAQKEAQKALQAFRYIDNGDGTVTDNKTGLIWLKKANCSGRKMTWEKAMQWAAKLANGQCSLIDGSKAGDWRLPTIDEWEAMMDKRYIYPVLSDAAGTEQWKEGDAFSGVQYWYWSSSEDDPSSAWVVDLDGGGVLSSAKTYTVYVWAVRGGH